jgi:hypothetical protein
MGSKILSNTKGTLLLGDPELVPPIVWASCTELESRGRRVVKLVEGSGVVRVSTETSVLVGLLAVQETALPSLANCEAEDD